MYLMIIDGFTVEPHALAKWTKPLPHLHNVRLHMATAAGKVVKSRFAKTPEIDWLPWKVYELQGCLPLNFEFLGMGVHWEADNLCFVIIHPSHTSHRCNPSYAKWNQTQASDLLKLAKRQWNLQEWRQNKHKSCPKGRSDYMTSSTSHCNSAVILLSWACLLARLPCTDGSLLHTWTVAKSQGEQKGLGAVGFNLFAIVQSFQQSLNNPSTIPLQPSPNHTQKCLWLASAENGQMCPELCRSVSLQGTFVSWRVPFVYTNFFTSGVPRIKLTFKVSGTLYAPNWWTMLPVFETAKHSKPCHVCGLIGGVWIEDRSQRSGCLHRDTCSLPRTCFPARTYWR